MDRHEKELRAFAQRAAKLAELIHQDWGSAAPRGDFQEIVNRDITTHGPDHALLNVERQLSDVIKAIEAYLRRLPEG
jgi:hypothetical protein